MEHKFKIGDYVKTDNGFIGRITEHGVKKGNLTWEYGVTFLVEHQHEEGRGWGHSETHLTLITEKEAKVFLVTHALTQGKP